MLRRDHRQRKEKRSHGGEELAGSVMRVDNVKASFLEEPYQLENKERVSHRTVPLGQCRNLDSRTLQLFQERSAGTVEKQQRYIMTSLSETNREVCHQPLGPAST